MMSLWAAARQGNEDRSRPAAKDSNNHTNVSGIWFECTYGVTNTFVPNVHSIKILQMHNHMLDPSFSQIYT